MAKNKNIFVTITGFKHYYGLEPFKIGNLIRCIKEPGNGKRIAHLRARAQTVLRPCAVHHLHQDHLPRRIRRHVRSEC